MKRNNTKIRKYSPKKSTNRYNSKIPKNLLTILKNEISQGNFRIKTQPTDSIQEGFVYYKKRNYFIVYDVKNNRITTILSEEGYNRYKKHI